MIIARRVRVTGQVQGVFYRAWTQRQAETLKVAGWVRNCPDGSVEAHIEGDDKSVADMIERLRQGPSHARVEAIETSDVEPSGLNTFGVRN